MRGEQGGGPGPGGRPEGGPPVVAAALREARLRLGLTQQELATRAGVTRQAIGAIEAGQMTPSLAVALRLARALGCRVEDLFRLEEPPPEVVVELAPAPDGDGGAQVPAPEAPPGGRILVGRVGGRWVGHLLHGDAAFAADLVPAGARLIAPAGEGPVEPQAVEPGAAPGDAPPPAGEGRVEPGAGEPAAALGDAAAPAGEGPVNPGVVEPAAPPAGGRRWRAALLEDPQDLDRSVLVAGCAPELSLWARTLAAGRHGARLHRLAVNSRRALELLRAGTVHAAGVHVAGGPGEPDNLAFIRAMLPGLAAVVIRLGVWEEGLLVAPGNPLGLRSVADLARPGVVVVNREPGAGSRLLLERCLAAAGIPPQAVAGFDRFVPDHLQVARAVARGEADAGVSTAAVAAAFGLGFIPLRAVAYDLVFLRPTLDEPAVQALLGTLGDAWVRRQLAALGGFDTTATGTVMARLDPDPPAAHAAAPPPIGSDWSGRSPQPAAPGPTARSGSGGPWRQRGNGGGGRWDGFC
ncbi:substrate-binding domain-containing protein [Thermaerobacter litoralis]